MLRVHPIIYHCLTDVVSSGNNKKSSIFFFLDYSCSFFVNYSKLTLGFSSVVITCHLFLFAAFFLLFAIITV